MGGILRKLVENENEITVAYMTSGNIAVFDHDVRRHLDFVERASETLGIEGRAVSRVRADVEKSLEQKAPGEVDLPAVQALKRIIRESEAVAALGAVGLPPNAARFLNLTFYRTGKSAATIGRRMSPWWGPCSTRASRRVFVAGDLPTRTARTGCPGGDRAGPHNYGCPRRRLVYGARGRMSITEADVLVPLSHDELGAKVLAIFKHQSQKDTAPFPGPHDDREFWQRVEARNLETAALANRLGLPEYYAMEAFVTVLRSNPGR